mmetsp:Transcript_18653/g.34761  ORF Transcript_18653/g.34761 Transcript_18653/m.34761 type:complete len:254 (-) Transcript_18653:101-862(-)
MSARGIYDNDLIMLRNKLLHAFFGNGNRVCFCVRPVEWHPQFGSILFQLVKGTRTERIGADHRHFPSSTLVVIGVLGDGCRLTASLQSHKQNDIRLSAFHCVRFPTRLQQIDQFFHHGLLHKLRDITGSSFSFLFVVSNVIVIVVVLDQFLYIPLDVFTQVHYQLDVDIGFNEGSCDLRQNLIQLRRRDMSSMSVQLAKRIAKFSTQLCQHHGELLVNNDHRMMGSAVCWLFFLGMERLFCTNYNCIAWRITQ